MPPEASSFPPASSDSTSQWIPRRLDAANRRNYRNGRYHNDRRQPAGSPDNPIPVGMEGCSHTLFFDLDSGLWELTDGLGNGYIR